MGISYQIVGSILTVNNKKIAFKFNIEKVIEIEELLVVLLGDTLNSKQSINIEEQPLNNVYVINNLGQIKWEIKNIIKKDGLYTNIGINKFNHLVITEFFGAVFIIDPYNGKLIEQGETK